MAIHRYMTTREYVRDWTFFDAIREFIANGFDAEVEHRAPCTVRHDKGALVIENQGVKVDVKALYFGGTTKAANSQLIGQYGEGLKLALLLCAREQIDVKVTNGDETWTPSFETDDNGVESFVIRTRSITNKGVFRVEIPGVSDDDWFTIQQLFLKLMPPVETFVTTHGEILLDMEYRGRRYAKGVYIDKEAGSQFGYNFLSLNVGRDRKSYRVGEASNLISAMWVEVTRNGENAELCYNAMCRNGPEFVGLQYNVLDQLPAQLLKVFREKHGEDAYPVETASEGIMLEHTGLKAVTCPYTLCRVLRLGLPTISEVLQQDRQKVTKTYGIEELTHDERRVLKGLLRMIEHLPVKVLPAIVAFKSASLEGLHHEGDILLARESLRTFGKALGVYLHEAAHLGGAEDGTKGHVDRMHELIERAFDVLGSDFLKGS